MPSNVLNPLVDGDYLVYRTGFAADSQAKLEVFGEDWRKLDADAIREGLNGLDYEHWALANAKTVLNFVFHEVFPGHDYYKLFLSGKDNFREQMATLRPYKGNRDPNFKPKYYQQCRDYLIDTWGAVVVDGMEADDAMGIEQFKNKDRSTVIVAVDKDMDLIPGWHYNWVKKEQYYINIDQANLNFLIQMLEGDASDNVPGIKGIARKTALKMFQGVGYNLDACYQLVIQQYKKQYLNSWVEAFNEVAALLWILREEGKPCPYLLAGV